jgi:hypothetical protein
MTRESCVPARRAARSGTASCADAGGESRVPAQAAGSPDPAAGLAARQAELVAALVAGGPVPSGFDPGLLAVTRRALLRKRAGEAAAVWPLLAVSLGPAWSEAFSASVATRPPAGALREGWDLALELHRRGELGDAAAVELAEREVTLHRADGRRRRLPAVRRCVGGVIGQLGGRLYHDGVR